MTGYSEKSYFAVNSALFAIIAFSAQVGHAQSGATPVAPGTVPAAEVTKPAVVEAVPASNPEDKFTFGGYFRLGYNTDINPLWAASDSQGTSASNASRHIGGVNYYRLELIRSPKNGTTLKVSLEGDGHTTNQLSEKNPTQGFVRVRDLFAAIPVSDSLKLWAGSRKMSYEEIRIFDKGNIFNWGGIGVGVESTDGWSAALLYQKPEKIRKAEVKVDPPAVAATPPATAEVDTSSMLLHGRYTADLGNGFKVNPMISLKIIGAASEQTVAGNSSATPPTVEKKLTASDAALDFKIGASLNRTMGADSGSTIFSVHSQPVLDPKNDAKYTGANLMVSLSDNGVYDFGTFGLLTGVVFEYTGLKNEAPVFEVKDNAIVAKNKSGTPPTPETTKSFIKASVGLQPVYYVSDRFHAALDIGYSFKSQKTSATDANLTTITPILRYAVNKTAVGSPQIYTSFTYGMYDAKVKNNSKLEKSKSLVTTQTGFEYWF